MTSDLVRYYIADQACEVTDARSVVHGLCKGDSVISDAGVNVSGLRPVSQSEYEAHCSEMGRIALQLTRAYEEAEVRGWDDD